MNFLEHAVLARKTLQRYEDIHAICDVKFCVNAAVFIWKTRYRAIYLFSMVALWLSEHPVSPKYGATIKEWRRSNPKVGTVVTRNIVAIGAQQKTFTRAEIEVAVGNGAKATAIKTVIRTGVELGLIKQCSGSAYSLTQLCLDEAFDRCLFKLLTPQIIEFCEYVVMANNMRKISKQTSGLQETGKLGTGNFQSFSETVFAGHYDDDIFPDGGRPIVDA
tara:strand:+ start:261 stop:917 length:657 start_codon:yes stop_codon:yes gene_type:complete